MNTQDLKDPQHRTEEGETSAQYELGMMYYEGRGVPRNYEEAVRLFCKSARNEHVDAKFYFGKMCLECKGVQKMNSEHVKSEGLFELRNVAYKDHVGAQLYLGKIYSEGEVVERDVAEAYKWYKMAATQGNEEAVKKLDELEKDMSPEEIAYAQRGPFG